MQLPIGGQAVTWDPAQHPYWPPVDRDGKIISDLPWKFFDPPAVSADHGSSGQAAGR